MMDMKGGMLARARRDWLVYAVIALGALIQVLLVTRSFDFILTNLLPDDAFYYFEIARHIVNGAGSTFDGMNPTNGYHPLWMLMLLPVYALFSVGGTMDIAPIYVALALSVLMNIGTALVLSRLLLRVTLRPAYRAVALLLWCLSPFILYESLNGLETSLALFFASLFFLFAVRIEEQDRAQDYAIAGVVAGLMVLARMDLAVYAIAFALWLVLRFGLREGVMKAFRVGAIALVVASPWFAWNYLEFGMILTSAANANAIINHALVVADNGPGLITELKGSAYLLVYHANALLERSGIAWLAFGFLGVAAALLMERPLAFDRRRIPVLVALFAGFIALFLINAGIRFTGRTWYFVSANIFLIVIVAWSLERIKMPPLRARYALASLAFLIMASFALCWHIIYRDQSAQHRTMLEMAQYMNATLPEGTRVGVFNAGIQAYFSSMQVVNLDGLVNNASYEAIRDRRLWTYVEESDIAYISDFDLYLSYRYAPFLDVPDVFERLREVHRIGPAAEDARFVDGLTLYEVLP